MHSVFAQIVGRGRHPAELHYIVCRYYSAEILALAIVTFTGCDKISCTQSSNSLNPLDDLSRTGLRY